MILNELLLDPLFTQITYRIDRFLVKTTLWYGAPQKGAPFSIWPRVCSGFHMATFKIMAPSAKYRLSPCTSLHHFENEHFSHIFIKFSLCLHIKPTTATMRNLVCLLLLIAGLSSVSFAQTPITLEDIWLNGTYSPKSVEGFNFTPDGNHYLRQEGKQIKEYSLATGLVTRTLFNGNKLPDLPDFDSYTFSSDGKQILLSANTEQIYRHSSKAQFFLVSTENGATTELLPGGKIMYATFSPDAKKVAYVYANNLFYHDLTTKKTTQITTDGAPNKIINGASDWVYEEEFVLVRAFEWSEDSKTIAWVRFDETLVPEFTMETYDSKQMYPGKVKFKYPKVGEKNSKVLVWLYDIASAKSIHTNISDPEFYDHPAEYIPRIKWMPNHSLCVTTLNRLQNHLKLYQVSRNNGQGHIFFEEKSKTYLELHDNLRFLDGGKSFLWTSERDGFNHVYLHQVGKAEGKQLTTGKFDVTEFYGYDEKTETVYYQAAACSATEREVYKRDVKTGKCQRLSPKKGGNSATFGPGFNYFSLRHSTINTPPLFSLHEGNGTQVRILEDNQTIVKNIDATSRVQAEFFDFKSPNGERLNGYMLKPKGVERSNEKHPVLMFVYGGPGSQQALNDWRGSNYWWFQHLVQQGYVVACVDNRGTGGRGAAFRTVTYGQLGKYETEDQIAAAKWLGNLKFVDKSRIGIFGWSYGGYMSSRSLFEGNKVFKAAIAVAPVTNWKWYDSVYTERYMGLYAQNQAGYDANAPIAFAEQLEGEYLLVHGLADDNVHFQNTAELAAELIKHGKQYQTMFYPIKITE